MQQQMEPYDHLAREVADLRRQLAERDRAVERYQSLFEHSPDAIFVEDFDGTVLDANPAAGRLHGCPRDALIGKHVLELVPPSERAAVAIAFQRLHADVDAVEGWSLTCDGRAIPVEIRLSRITYADQPAMLLFVRDITARKQAATALHTSEQKLSLHVQQTPLAYIEWTPDFHITAWNAGAERIFGYGAQEMIGQHGSQLVPEAYRPQLDAVWQALLTHHGGTRSTNENVTRDGRVITCEWYNRPLVHDDGQVLGVASLAHDVSERITAATALQHAHDELEQRVIERTAALQAALQVRDEFLSVAAHELRTPITSIVGFVQLLLRRAEREGAWAPRDIRALHTLDAQAARLNRLIVALLDLSRLQNQQLKIERQPVDWGALVQRVVAETEPMLTQHQVVCTLPPAPLVIQGDELRLAQVLQNLLQNALKYSPEGGTITVEVRQQPDGVYTSVTDQGIGIAPAAMPHLWSRFYRADNAIAGQINGMGVGLFVVHQIVTLHGGTVHVASTEGQGSTFTVCLPVGEAPNNGT